MWIVLYPDSSYVEPMAAASATFTIPKGSIQDADSRKTPPHLLHLLACVHVQSSPDS